MSGSVDSARQDSDQDINIHADCAEALADIVLGGEAQLNAVQVQPHILDDASFEVR